MFSFYVHLQFFLLLFLSSNSTTEKSSRNEYFYLYGITEIHCSNIAR